MQIRRFILLLVAAFLAYPPGKDNLRPLYPLELYSREGILLKQFRNSAGAYGSALPISEYPPDLVRAVILAEDAHFLDHPGFDARAVARSAVQNLRSLRIRSGASTIPQQLARIIYAPLMPQNRFLRKMVETMLSFKLSLTHSKAELLELYLNQVPMPFNSSGLSAASQRLFGKHVHLLNDEEIVALTVIISQGHIGSNRFAERFTKLWQRLYRGRPDPVKEIAERLQNIRPPVNEPYLASGHFVNWLSESGLPSRGQIQTEISAGLNSSVQRIIANELAALRQHGAEHAAVIVIEKGDEEDFLRSMVGSSDFTADNAGELNHAVRIRSAGSTLKPFVYGIGLDSGVFGASTMFSDREYAVGTGTEGETFRPQNNDMRFWGDLTLRESLVASRNVPAVQAVQKVGVARLRDFLVRAGFTHLTEIPEHYGPGLALGSGGTTLLMLARAYSALASSGELRALRLGQSGKSALRFGERRLLFSPGTAGRLTDMLSDTSLRRRAFGRRNFLDFPFPVAAKTGTSKDYRDGWVAGYTPRFVVAVWVGNSAGQPMQSVSGAWGAGRIFHQVMRLVSAGEKRAFSAPANLRRISICRRSGQLAGENCPAHREFAAASEKLPGLCPLRHDRTVEEIFPEETLVISPASGERFLLNPSESRSRQEIPVIIRGSASAEYSVNNTLWKPVGPGVREFLRLDRGDHVLRIRDRGEILQEIDFSVR